MIFHKFDQFDYPSQNARIIMYSAMNIDKCAEPSHVITSVAHVQT